MKKFPLIFALLIINTFGQVNNLTDTKVNDNDMDNKARQVLELFEEGINEGEVKKFSTFFSDETYISLKNSISGTFSSNQLYYIMQDYFNVYHPYSFRLTNLVTNTKFPYATGEMNYSYYSVKGKAKVYISLDYLKNSWRIVQISIQ
ncbi:MAG: DUF4783 domain-containing protein [Ignavibacteria bacterium]